MRLKLKAKNTTSTKKKTSSGNKKKADKEFKVMSNYSDISEFKYTDVDITLNKLKYCHIIYCDIKSVTIPDGSMEVDDSWIGLILVMLDTVRLNHPDNFIEYLMENGVTTQTFCVDTTYGKYSFDENQYKAYNLYDSGFYLEALFDVENIFWSIVRLSKCLDIPLNKFSVRLLNTMYSVEDIKLTELTEESIIVNACDSLTYFKKGVFLRDICILDMHTTVHRIEHVIAIFCNRLMDVYGEDVFKKLPTAGDTRISRTDSIDSSQCMEIRHSGYYVYSDLKPKSVIKFIVESMNKLELSKDSVRFYFRKLKKKEEKAEWELD